MKSCSRSGLAALYEQIIGFVIQGPLRRFARFFAFPLALSNEKLLPLGSGCPLRTSKQQQQASIRFVVQGPLVVLRVSPRSPSSFQRKAAPAQVWLSFFCKRAVFANPMLMLCSISGIVCLHGINLEPIVTTLESRKTMREQTKPKETEPCPANTIYNFVEQHGPSLAFSVMK